MAKGVLVDEDIDAGERLVRALNAGRMSVSAAFWLYSSESGFWYLHIASPLVDREGPRVAYAQVQKAIAGTDGVSGIALDDIKVVGNRDRTASALRAAIKRGVEPRTRMANNVVDGVFIDGAIVYGPERFAS
jgi:hypothetical protein